MQDVWDVSELLTGDTHVAVCGLAWGFADVPMGTKYDADKIARMIEDWMPNNRYRQLNTTFAGLRQLYFYEGDAARRTAARLVIERLARENQMLQKITGLVLAKESDYIPKQQS